MAYEIRKERVFGNFRPTVAERHTAKVAAQRQREREAPGKYPAHLALVRLLPCVKCGTIAGVQPHHLRHGPAATRGLGQKASDLLTVPLCWMHHDECHRTGGKFEAQWFDRFAFQPINYASALASNTNNYARMRLVHLAHVDDARKRLNKRAAVNVLMAHGLTRNEAEEQYDTGRMK